MPSTAPTPSSRRHQKWFERGRPGSAKVGPLPQPDAKRESDRVLAALVAAEERRPRSYVARCGASHRGISSAPSTAAVGGGGGASSSAGGSTLELGFATAVGGVDRRRPASAAAGRRGQDANSEGAAVESLFSGDVGDPDVEAFAAALSGTDGAARRAAVAFAAKQNARAASVDDAGRDMMSRAAAPLDAARMSAAHEVSVNARRSEGAVESARSKHQQAQANAVATAVAAAATKQVAAARTRDAKHRLPDEAPPQQADQQAVAADVPPLAEQTVASHPAPLVGRLRAFADRPIQLVVPDDVCVKKRSSAHRSRPTTAPSARGGATTRQRSHSPTRGGSPISPPVSPVVLALAVQDDGNVAAVDDALHQLRPRSRRPHSASLFATGDLPAMAPGRVLRSDDTPWIENSRSPSPSPSRRRGDAGDDATVPLGIGIDRASSSAAAAVRPVVAINIRRGDLHSMRRQRAADSALRRKALRDSRRRFEQQPLQGGALAGADRATDDGRARFEAPSPVRIRGHTPSTAAASTRFRPASGSSGGGALPIAALDPHGRRLGTSSEASPSSAGPFDIRGARLFEEEDLAKQAAAAAAARQLMLGRGPSSMGSFAAALDTSESHGAFDASFSALGGGPGANNVSSPPGSPMASHTRRSRLDPIYRTTPVHRSLGVEVREATHPEHLEQPHEVDINGENSQSADWLAAARDMVGVAEPPRQPHMMSHPAAVDAAVSLLSNEHLAVVQETLRARQAAGGGLTAQSAAAGARRNLRQALVVGVGSYPNDTRIHRDPQPATDAADIAALLQGMGFETVLLSTAAVGRQCATSYAATSESPKSGGAALRAVPSSGLPTRDRILREASGVNKRAQQALQQHLKLLRTPGTHLTSGQLDTNPEAAPVIVFCGAGFHAADGIGERRQSRRLLLPMDSTLTAAMQFTDSMKSIDVQPLTLDDLALATSDAHDAVDSATDRRANTVIADTFAALRTPPSFAPDSNGFFIAGGARAVGSELVADYTSTQRLLGSFYLRRALQGYATRDSRLTTNGVNDYIGHKLRTFGAAVVTTSSRHFVGDFTLAKASELPLTRADVARIKDLTHTNPATFTVTLLPLRNQDPRTHHFTREFERCLAKSLKGEQQEALRTLRCNGRVLTGRFALFVGTSADISRWMREDSSRKGHEVRVADQLSRRNGAAAYRLNSLGRAVAGIATFSTRFSTSQFISSVTATGRPKLSAAGHPTAAAAQDGPAHSGQAPSATSVPLPRTFSGTLITKSLAAPKPVVHPALVAGRTDQPPPPTTPSVNRARERLYLADMEGINVTLDHFSVHAVGAEVRLSFTTTEYMARKADRALRIGAVVKDTLLVSGMEVTVLGPDGQKRNRVAIRVQAAFRGRSLRRSLGPVLAVMRRERGSRASIVDARTSELLDLQRDMFCAARQRAENHEADIRRQRYELQGNEFAHLAYLAMRAVERIEAHLRERLEINAEGTYGLVVEHMYRERFATIEGPRVAFMVFVSRSTALAHRQHHQRQGIAHEQAVAWKKLKSKGRMWH